MAWNEMNERRMKELELISSSLGLTAPQVEEIEELIDLKEQSDAKPEYRKPTKWDVNRKCEVFSERYGSGSWVEATILYGLVSGGGAYVRLKRNAKLELYAAGEIRILVDEDDIEWQFKCKMLDIIAEHAGDLNSRCFQAPFEDERTGRIYSLKLEWLNRERFCEPVPATDPIKRPFRWCKSHIKGREEKDGEFDCVEVATRLPGRTRRYIVFENDGSIRCFADAEDLSGIRFIDGETL